MAEQLGAGPPPSLRTRCPPVSPPPAPHPTPAGRGSAGHRGGDAATRDEAAASLREPPADFADDQESGWERRQEADRPGGVGSHGRSVHAPVLSSARARGYVSSGERPLRADGRRCPGILHPGAKHKKGKRGPCSSPPRSRRSSSWYEGDNPGVKGNLARILMHGRLGGTGKVVILPVDQGFEHGPARSFAPNPAGLRPALPLPAGDRGRAERLCRAARHDRGGRRHLRRPDPDHPEGEQRRTAWPAAPDQAVTASVEGRAAPRLLGDRLHHLSGLGRLLERWRSCAR